MFIQTNELPDDFNVVMLSGISLSEYIIAQFILIVYNKGSNKFYGA